jgi:hypothetical protein
MSYEKLRKIAIYGAVASISGAFILHHYTQGILIIYHAPKVHLILTITPYLFQLILLLVDTTN